MERGDVLHAGGYIDTGLPRKTYGRRPLKPLTYDPNFLTFFD